MLYIFQSDKNEPLSDSSKMISLRSDPQKLKASFQEKLSNSAELNDLGELPSCVAVDSPGGV